VKGVGEESKNFMDSVVNVNWTVNTMKGGCLQGGDKIDVVSLTCLL
jgi:hypothetical protein